MTKNPLGNIRKIYVFKFFINLYFIGGVLIPFFTMWGRISFTQVMFLEAWFMLWVFLLEIPSGSVADYLGRKNTLILASIAHIIAVVIYTSIPLFFIFMLGEFMWALAEALMTGTNQALIYDSLKAVGDAETEKAKIIYGRSESFNLAGLMIAAPIGSFLAAFIDLRAPMLFMALPFAGGLIVALTFQEPQTSQNPEKKQYRRIMKEGVKFFYQHKILKILAFEMIAIGAVAFLMIWLYQSMLIQLNINIAYFGVIHAIILGSEIVVMNSYNRLERLFRSKRRYLLFSGLITGTMFLVASLSLAFQLLPLMLVAIVLAIAFGMTRAPLLISYMNKHIPSPERATVLSTINMFQTLSFVIVYPLVGFAADWSLIMTLLILGIAGIGFSLISRVKEEYLID
ncbi:MAG: MFS transporter [Candidatus Helarchaeota archaeon]|nr:MFS transporter [Candidatus Helarchaeota archaeon]